MRSRNAFAATLAFVAAVMAPTAIAAADPPTAGGAAGAREDAAAIARVEHGLIPEVRVAGERGGWSIEERMRVHHAPAVSVAVIHDGRVAWARAWGVADLRSGRRVDADTPFQAASISKMVTALAALREADAGKVDVDADINRALTSWKLPANDFTRKHAVTLAELLSHTAGTNVHSVIGHAPDAPLPTLTQILDGIPPANTEPVRVVAEPGKSFAYSGGGSLIVQQLVVDLTRQPFADAVHALVFAPLGMTHSSFAILPTPAERARQAVPHDRDLSILPDLVYPESAPAGMWSTPTDLARMLVEIQRGLDGRSPVISRRVAKWMTTAAAKMEVPGASTGLGTFVEDRGGAFYFGHDGLNDGFLSMARATVNGGDGAVVMCNGMGGAQLIFEIFRSIAAEYHWPGWLPPPVERVALDGKLSSRLAGDWSAGLDRPLTIVVSGSRVEAREPFSEPRELIPVAGGALVARDRTRFELRGDALVESPPDDDAVTHQRHAGAAEPLRLLQAGKDAEALAAYRALMKAHAADPALSVARFDELASALLDDKDAPADALRIFDVEAALHPDSAYAVAGLALAHLRGGDKAGAAPLAARMHVLAKLPMTEIEKIYLGVRMERVDRLLKK
jgi:CubicO group peptidase (beta-lactamase class C family)